MMIDIRIMAHPSRRENVMKTLSALNLTEEVVTWDDREQGGDAMYTAKKAWNTPMPEGCTHRLVLQDDIELCDNFLEIVNQVAEKHPSEVVSLFHCEEYPKHMKYVRTGRLWGCAVMIPAILVPACWEYIETIPELPMFKKVADKIMPHDNDCIMIWATNNNIPIINTVPSLVQHIGDDSLVGAQEKRVATDFIKSPSVIGW